jgi:high-affinity iron transporter
MFQTFLITLREGLEASLVVGILIGFLVRSGNRNQLRNAWIGVGAAVALSLAAGFALTFVFTELDSFRLQEAFGGIMSIIAVIFVTCMVFWMRAQSRSLKGELSDRLGNAVAIGGIAVTVTTFVAVAREGLETALFLWPTFNAVGSGAGPTIGAVIGLAVAIGIGVLIYKGSVRLNLATFFKVTGVLLIIVAAGVLAYGFHDLQEANLIGGGQNYAFDVSSAIPATSWYGTLLKGIFNFSPQMTWVEVIIYFAYLVPTMALFLRPVRSDHTSTPPATRQPAVTAQ